MSPAMAPPAEKGSNFAVGFWVLPKAKREALRAVYRYCRLIDDVVDSGSLRSDEALRLLGFWREEIERLYAGTPTHSVSLELAAHVERFRLPKEPFLEMIRGCEMDVEPAPYGTFEELKSYMRGVACSVGALAVEIFGYRHSSREDMSRFALDFGYAFQLTNIIRDVGSDLELGRVYIPEEDMREVGYSRERLLGRAHDAAFERLMALECRRARDFYRSARGRVDFRDRPGLLAAEMMAHVYEGVLEEIERGGFRVLFQKASLPPWRKLGLAFKAWLYCRGLYGV
ncbi:MAG: squalene/phytoene synthase family protein [Elusimicrobia bacterium]|nr:squalene/phytoene synthase family protein [Elusimicrobiota bacterium]